jgi:hypothetical protein
MNNFEIVIKPRQPEKSGLLLFQAVSKNTQKEVRVNIVKLLVKREGETDFREVDDFKILASGFVEKTFRMDLDPLEIREYGVSFECDACYDFQIIARDKDGFEFTATGSRGGISLSELPKPTEAPIKTPVLNTNVRVVNKGTFIITPEDGTPNDFGIFDKHEINPTAAYIALGRDGYKTLRGKHFAELDWDRDTMASPPDDLWAVHVRRVDSSEHGWFFRTHLLFNHTTSS